MNAVPALRFSGFSGTWKPKKVGEIATFSKGKGISKADISDDGETPCIRYGELYTRYNEVIDEVASHTHVDPTSLKLSCGNEVIIPASGEVAWDIATASCVINAGVALGGDLNILRTKEMGHFIAYYISGKLKHHVARLAQGNSVVHVYGEQISSVKIHVPVLPEQKKIANFLGTVDDKIEGLRERERLLTLYKKGVMQKIFAQDIRFKADDGSAFPDWERTTIADVYDWIRTNSLSRANLNYEGGEVKNIHYGDIHTKFSKVFRQEKENLPFIMASLKSDFSETEFCQLGDVVFADASEDYDDIGKAIEIVELGDIPLVAGLHTYIARPKQGFFSIGFSAYLFQSWGLRYEIMRIAQGISVLGISKTNMAKIEFRMPHRDEQQKIADFLSAIDAKITAVSAQITQMQAFKKGLLQQMFV